MKSLLEFYRWGQGPSSSHTIGPYRIIGRFLAKYPFCTELKITLYGSLALTGKGHGTDTAIQRAAGDRKIEIVWNIKTRTECPNTMDVAGFCNGVQSGFLRGESPGGGTIKILGDESQGIPNVFLNKFTDIKKYCIEHKMSLYDYVATHDPKGIEILPKVWQIMKNGIFEGLKRDEPFTNPIKLSRKAKKLYETIQAKKLPKDSLSYCVAYAYAVGEVNVSGGEVVTSPTLGAAAMIPSILYYAHKHKDIPENKIIEALAVVGLIGMLYKTNGLVGGAVGGCQAEIGSACSIGAAAYCYLFGGNFEEIETAAIIGMEHHLGLTCDPVLGHVYSPCIERNAAICTRAILAAEQAILTEGVHDIFSLDDIIKVQKRTGLDLRTPYKETGLGGLSKLYKEKHHIKLN